jgi:dynein heavy chain
VVSDFSLVDPMYQFSLSYFKRLFGGVIQSTAKSPTMDERILSLLTAITETTYLNVCRGLFNAHKRIFSFLMTAKIQLKSGEITPTEWSQFVRGAPIPKEPVQVPKEAKLTEKQWNELTYMSAGASPVYLDLTRNVQNNFKGWEVLLHAENPWVVPIPEL